MVKARHLVFVLSLVACGKAEVVADPEPEETAVEDTSPPGACETWEEFSCLGGGNNCTAQCQPRYKIVCDTVQCFIQGDGFGSGRSCNIDVPNEDGCRYCKEAFERCIAP